MSDDEIIAIAVSHRLGRTMKPIGMDTGDVFFTDASYRTDELLSFARAIEQEERQACANLCDELGQHWNDYKDTALLNGDVALSNAASGEPRAARAVKAAILARRQRID